MRLIDLTTPYDGEYSCAQLPAVELHNELTWARTLAREGNYVTDIHISSHTGTHLDAPMHVLSREEKKGMYYLGDIPLERLYGETVCWDIPKGELEPITADDFEKANKKLPVKEGDILLIYTHWGHYYFTKNPRYLFNKCPGLEFDGAEWCVSKKIKAYGQDTVGTQYKAYSFVQSDEVWQTGAKPAAEPVHRLMLSNDIVLLEHLTNLDKIAGRRVTCGFFPLPLQDREGAPMRAVAFLDD